MTPWYCGWLCLCVFLAVWFDGRYVIWAQRAKGAASTHVPALVGIYLMLIFYAYIYLTKTSLDIFNCNPTTPPDGHKYVVFFFFRLTLLGLRGVALPPRFGVIF